MADAIRIRVTLKDEVADVKALMTHPMETGLRKDPITGELVPIHFIQTVQATHNGKVVLNGQWSQAVSKNPFIHFRVKDAHSGDTISIAWQDTHGERNSIDAKVP
jgi:sulfur-oxidizing protein SoxZ